MSRKPRAGAENQEQGGGIRPWAAYLLVTSLVVSAVMMAAASLTAHAREPEAIPDAIAVPSIPSESFAQAEGPAAEPAEGSVEEPAEGPAAEPAEDSVEEPAEESAEEPTPTAVEAEPRLPAPLEALPVTRAKPLRGVARPISLPPAALGQGWTGGVRLRLPFSGRAQITQGPHMGEALDFAPSQWGVDRWNGDVLAAGAGRVIFAGVDNRQGSCPVPGKPAGYGKLVIIEHSGEQLTHSYYSHLDSIQVQPGESVSMGQVIGIMGDTGCSTGPHLHFEVRQGVVAGTIRTGLSIPIVGLPGIDLATMTATGP